MSKPKVTQLLDARGRTIIERRGTRPATIADDAYHLLRTVSWQQALGSSFGDRWRLAELTMNYRTPEIGRAHV